ncbi:seryl-tRNA synthetase [Saccharata proteae CBS 121410]|uniref:serine--tRNA ligase n=1 Tax=Saccharata proteae CBS 121410 TaxID=1314787 RepID=A0A9P4LZI3_9PEZI|nr:seryl-tRNA synthetase [Saccharata proteae CBS 121410]
MKSSASRSLFSCSSCSSCLLRSIPYTRPATAPKVSPGLKHIRQNPGLYAQNCLDRNYKAQSTNSWRILELFAEWQACQSSARGLRERGNTLRRKLANAASRSGDAEGDITMDKTALQKEGKEVKAELSVIEEKEKELTVEMERLALELPNLSSLSTPTGSEPEVIGYINEHPELNATEAEDRVWRSHVHIGAELGLLDFAAAATTSGWGWYYLINEAAMLEQALIQYSLSVARKRGWTVVSPPSIVYAHMAAACGFQPRDQHGEQQIYTLEQPAKDAAKPPLVLAGTAEIPLAGMKANTIIEEANLPIKYIGVNRCYRAEAGARGVDTKGLYRVHEFTKVEMFAWTLPDATASSTSNEDGNFATTESTSASQPSPSDQLFDEILSIQTEILTSLGLHCRILEMPSTDLGASAARKRDIEAFFPSRREKDNGWGEVTSTSVCTDYQTRRLHTRVKLGKEKGGALDFPYTLNGTAMAVPRVLAAILENGWDEKRMCVRVPECLRPFMGGAEVIERKMVP